MAIVVRLPVLLQNDQSDTLTITESVLTVADLIDVLEQQLPGFRTQFDDAMINIAVNNEMLLHRAGDRTLTDGDIVEIVPAIAGGESLSLYWSS
jgi:molybdopterin converting factor small subunit|tara:strand:- start:627 stop:908 length:282 start_codon:yes stop_codon:yes gene_type:complete